MELNTIRASLNDKIEHAADSELAELAGVVAEAQVRIQLRVQGRRGAATPAEADLDENLGADAAAKRLGISRDWLYKNAGRLPFARRIGRRLLFSAKGLERWNRLRRTS